MESREDIQAVCGKHRSINLTVPIRCSIIWIWYNERSGRRLRPSQEMKDAAGTMWMEMSTCVFGETVQRECLWNICYFYSQKLVSGTVLKRSHAVFMCIYSVSTN